jgi:hypothetical protein
MRKRCTLLAAGLLASAAQAGAQSVTIDNVTIVGVANGLPARMLRRDMTWYRARAFIASSSSS